MTRGALWAGAALCALSLACTRWTSPRANRQLHAGALSGSNLLLITIDTLRADRVGAYGGGSLTPAIDRLAAGGVRFAEARAHAPMTLPAHTSILTGLLPATHGVHTNGSTILSPGTPTLATMLHDHGYQAAAFVGAFVLDSRFGLRRGFDVYDDRVGDPDRGARFTYAERTADRVTTLTGDWITARGASHAPWFVWMHLFDPHAPYQAPIHRGGSGYDDEVAYADQQLGRLFDRLRAAGELDRTLVVLLADHGESLGEHGEMTHGLFAYDATLRIPLIIAGPGVQAQVAAAPASQIDLVPTILELLGISLPYALDGHTLLPAIRGEGGSSAPLYIEALDANVTRNWAPLTGIVVNGWKYIDLPEAELYDLAHDPGEQHNVIAAGGTRVAAMQAQLAALRSNANDQPPPQALIDPDAAMRLRSLGYTAGAANSTPRKYTVADDPKRLLDIDKRFERALALGGGGEYREAAALLTGILAERPDFTAAALALASVFMAGGDAPRAASLLEAALLRTPRSAVLKARLGAAYLAAGDLPRAAAALQPVADLAQPEGLEAANTLAIVWTEQGQIDRARRLFAKVLEQTPGSARTWNNLGLLELNARRPRDAAAAFEHAVAADSTLAQAWNGLAAARAPFNPGAAIEAWTRAVALEPRNYDALFNLAVMLRQQGRIAEARPHIERFLREAPRDRYARDVDLLRGWNEK